MLKSRGKKSKKKGGKRNFLFYLLLVFASAAAAAIAAFNLYLASLPPISNFEDIKPNPVTSIYSSDGEIIKTFTVFKFEKISITEIPENLIKAVIATEDKNFYKHRGFDTFGLVRSVLANIQAGSLKQGASTITQQLARVLFLSNERTFDRKIKELIIAHRIEKTISKDEILEMYLNAVYLGSGTYGVLSASQTYFDKPLNELTLAEITLIAGLPQAPSVYSPFQNPDLAVKRRDQVLKRMHKMGYINKQQYNNALNEKLSLNQKPRTYSYNKAPYFVDFVLNELESLGFKEDEITQGGLKVYTTLDMKSQDIAQNAVVSQLKAWGLTRDVSQAALFSFSPTTGRIYAYIGGKNYEKSQYDRVTNAIRPPGSSFKPFVYTTAMQQGLRVDDILEDRPIVSANWSPRNYGNKFRGAIPAWLALAVSSNVCAVRLIQKTGVDAVISTARELGITTKLQHDQTIALGSNGVKLYDMVVAYGAYANGGFKVRPFAVERVENSRGVVIYESSGPKIVKVISFDTAAGMTYMLRKVIEMGTGRAADIGRAAAGKTGTTDNYKDAWFVGYTPNIVTGVWVGNDNNAQMGGVTGGTVPAKIWQAYMKAASENFPDAVFDYPEIKTQASEPIDDDPQEILESGEVIDLGNGATSAQQKPVTIEQEDKQDGKSGLFRKKDKSDSPPLPSVQDNSSAKKPFDVQEAPPVPTVVGGPPLPTD